MNMNTEARKDRQIDDEWALICRICDKHNLGTQEDVIELISETDFTGKKNAVDVAINAIELTPENIKANADTLKRFVDQADFEKLDLGFRENFRFGVLLEVLEQ